MQSPKSRSANEEWGFREQLSEIGGDHERAIESEAYGGVWESGQCEGECS